MTNLRFSRFFAAVVLGLMFLSRSAQAQVWQGINAMTCFKIRDSSRLSAGLDVGMVAMGRSTGIGEDSYGYASGCTISAAKMLCVPTQPVVSSVSVGGTSRPPTGLAAIDVRQPQICYKVKCPTAPTLPTSMGMADALGVRSVTTSKVGLLCLSAVDGAYNDGYCGDGVVNDDEECDVGGPEVDGVPCTNGACYADCRCHNAFACCYVDIPALASTNCISFEGTQQQTNTFIGNCNARDFLPGYSVEQGRAGDCGTSPLGYACTSSNTLRAFGTP